MTAKIVAVCALESRFHGNLHWKVCTGVGSVMDWTVQWVGGNTKFRCAVL